MRWIHSFLLLLLLHGGGKAVSGELNHPRSLANCTCKNLIVKVLVIEMHWSFHRRLELESVCASLLFSEVSSLQISQKCQEETFSEAKNVSSWTRLKFSPTGNVPLALSRWLTDFFSLENYVFARKIRFWLLHMNGVALSKNDVNICFDLSSPLSLRLI